MTDHAATAELATESHDLSAICKAYALFLSQNQAALHVGQVH